MKRYLIPLFMLLASFSAFAQEQDADVKEKFKEARIREFVYRLELTDQQKEAFVPIYEQYSEEMREAMGRPGKKGHGDKEKAEKKEMTSEAAAQILKERIARQQKAQEIRLKYIDEFATVLEPRQLMHLYETEDQIQRQLMNRKGGKMEPGHERSAPGGERHKNK